MENQLEPWSENKRSLVEVMNEVQISLHKHKEDIAHQVKNCLSNEMKIMMFTIHQNLGEGCLKSFADLEKNVLSEIQGIKLKIMNIENKVNEISGRFLELDLRLKDFQDKTLAALRKCSEKNIEIDQKTIFLRNDVEKNTEYCRNLSQEICRVRETQSDFRTDFPVLDQTIHQVRTICELYQIEIYKKINNDSLKIEEKINSLKALAESRQSQTTRLDQGKEIMEFIQVNISKLYSEVAPLKQRLELIEKNNQFISEFIKSRKN